MIYQQYFGSVQVLIDAFPPPQLPRKVGYAINLTLVESKALAKDDIRLLEHLKSLLDHSEFEERTTEVHDAVCGNEDDGHRLEQALTEQPWALSEGADVNQRDAQNQTPLQLAAFYHRSECLWTLLETKECRLDRVNNSSRTALHLAAQKGSAKAVAMLLDAGASAIEPSQGGNTPLHLLAQAKVDHLVAEEIVRLLRSKHADLNARDEYGDTPSMTALRFNNLPVLQALFEAGASLHVTNNHSENILHYAALFAGSDALEYLNSLRLEGINPELENKSGETPGAQLRWAMQAEENEFIRRPNPTTGPAFTRLHFGVVSRNLQSDLNTLQQLLQVAEQRDSTTFYVKLSTLISWKEACYQHQDVGLYRHVLHFVERGGWNMAMEEIQSGVQDAIYGLEFAHNVLEGLIDPFSSHVLGSDEVDDEVDEDLNDDLNDQSEWESWSSNDDYQDAAEGPSALGWLLNPFSSNDVEPDEAGQDASKDGPTVSESQSDDDSGGHEIDHRHTQEGKENWLSAAMVLMEFLSTLPELVGTVSSKLMPVPEPPVPTGKTRVRWRCSCGDDLFDDFMETKPGSLDALRARLSEVNRTHNSGQQQSNSNLWMLLSLPIAMGTWMKRYMMRLIVKGANAIPLYTLSPSIPRQGHSSPSQEVLHLLLCIDKGEPLTRLHQECLYGINEDKQLFSFLRDQYLKHRKLSSWFSLRSVKSVSLARFRVDANYFAGVHGHGAVCSSQCICLPPVARVESEEYRCAPAPMIELGYFPAIGSRELLHYFKKPHDFEIPQRIYLNQIPKRACGQLRASQDQAELGWGLHFEEGWHWKTIYFITVALVAIPAMVFGVVWSVTKRDIQSAFALSGAWIALGSLMLGYMGVRDV
ncbi:hypothetical protein ACHAPT_011214 [Fusarium lateritium]